MAKVQLGVIFGSRSCEREVSIISAVQLMNHVDSEKYDVIPVYIGENGVWYTGNALRRIETYTPFDPNKAGIEAVALDVTAGSGALLANRPGKGLFSHPTQVVVARLEVCVIVMHGLNGEDGTGSSPYYTMAAKADRQAMRIRAAFEAKGCAMLFDSPTNQQFPILPNSWYNALSEKYAMTLTAKPDAEHTAVRFCTSWATRNEDVDALLADIASL